MLKNTLRQTLIDIKTIQRGKFTLHGGKISSIYIDLRILVSYPRVLRAVAHLLWERIENKPHFLCGIPYTALPWATCMALDHNVPMLLCRKAPKEHGTKKQVEGIFNRGDSCVLVEDVVTTGSSVLKVAHVLRKEGLELKEVVALVDRQQGGKEALDYWGLTLSSVFTLSDFITKKEYFCTI